MAAPLDAETKTSLSTQNAQSEAVQVPAPLDATKKTQWARLMPVIACGAGLFSDGYLNGVRHSPPKKKTLIAARR